MENRNPLEPTQRDEPSEQALLAEYQACEQDNSFTTSNYWTLAGIFIGISSVLLAGLIYGVLANSALFQVLLQETTTSSALFQIVILTIVIAVLGAAIITILYILKRWLKRVNFLTDINYDRMREIELERGMWKSWRVHGVDHWNELTAEEKDRLIRYHPEDWWQKWRNESRYERPSRDWHYKWIFRILFSLWAIIIVVALLRVIMALISYY